MNWDACSQLSRYNRPSKQYSGDKASKRRRRSNCVFMKQYLSQQSCPIRTSWYWELVARNDTQILLVKRMPGYINDELLHLEEYFSVETLYQFWEKNAYNFICQMQENLRWAHNYHGSNITSSQSSLRAHHHIHLSMHYFLCLDWTTYAS